MSDELKDEYEEYEGWEFVGWHYVSFNRRRGAVSSWCEIDTPWEPELAEHEVLRKKEPVYIKI